jgi:hypothetical protein
LGAWGVLRRGRGGQGGRAMGHGRLDVELCSAPWHAARGRRRENEGGRKKEE